MLSRDSLLKRGQDLHKSGNLQAAADIYTQVLARNPRHDEALYLWDVSLTRQRTAEWLSTYYESCRAKTTACGISKRACRGSVLRGFCDEAEHRFRDALALDNRADYYAGLATLLRKKGREDEAIEVLEGALVQPSYRRTTWPFYDNSFFQRSGM